MLWPQPLSAQKGCGVARFVRVPGMRLMMIGGTLQSSHSLPTQIPAAHATSAVALILLQSGRLHHCTEPTPFDALTHMLAAWPPTEGRGDALDAGTGARLRVSMCSVARASTAPDSGIARRAQGATQAVANSSTLAAGARATAMGSWECC